MWQAPWFQVLHIVRIPWRQSQWLSKISFPHNKFQDFHALSEPRDRNLGFKIEQKYNHIFLRLQCPSRGLRAKPIYPQYSAVTTNNNHELGSTWKPTSPSNKHKIESLWFRCTSWFDNQASIESPQSTCRTALKLQDYNT